MIYSRLINGKGIEGKISDEGQLEVVVHPHPPRGESVTGQLLPFRQFMTADGTATGSSDMLVNGSSTAQEFYVSASQENDIYIKSVAFQIVDASATLSKFGNLTALTNGCELKLSTRVVGDFIIGDELKSNWDMIRLCNAYPAFGDGTSAFRAGNVVSTSEGYVPILDFSVVFGLPWGIRLEKGSEDRLVFTINDNVSTMDAFNAVCKGFIF